MRYEELCPGRIYYFWIAIFLITSGCDTFHFYDYDQIMFDFVSDFFCFKMFF